MHLEGLVENTGQVTAHVQHIWIDGLRKSLLDKLVLLRGYILLDFM